VLGVERLDSLAQRLERSQTAWRGRRMRLGAGLTGAT
jgi:hypothetical protein